MIGNQLTYLKVALLHLPLVVLSGLGIALTILFEVRAVQDGIHPLINHALTSDHPSKPCVHPAGSI